MSEEDRDEGTGDDKRERNTYWFQANNAIPGGTDGKESACNPGDLGSIPRLGWSPGEENGYPLQYSCLENPMDRGAWWLTVCGVAESDIRVTNTYQANHTDYNISSQSGPLKHYMNKLKWRTTCSRVITTNNAPPPKFFLSSLYRIKALRLGDNWEKSGS